MDQNEKQTGRVEAFSDYGLFAYVLTFGLAFVSAWASVGVSLALVLFYAFRGFLGKN